MYTKEIYKKEILQKIKDNGYDPNTVAKLTYNIFIKHQREMDHEVYEKLLDIANMEMGPEFEMTEEEFNQFLQKM